MAEKRTLDQRIDELLQKTEDKNQLKTGIKELIQRATFPQEFCPECDDKMFYQQDKRSYRCINCGFDTQKEVEVNRPSANKPLHPAVERALESAQGAERELKAPIRRIKPKVSEIDEEIVRQDPKVKGDINWV